MWWKLVLLTLYLAILFVLSRILETFAHYEGGYLASRLLDPVSLSVKKLKTLLDQRGVSYAGVVEKKELENLVEASGESTEGELEAASLADGIVSTSTNFTCGPHFYEEVEDTKDSVWVVLVVHTQQPNYMQTSEWKAFVKKVSRFGIRTGIFDCSLDWRLCDQKKWNSSRLVLALPQGYRAKDNVVLKDYTAPGHCQKIFDWVNGNLASRIHEISDIEELQNEWYHFEGRRKEAKVKVVLFSKLKIQPMFYSVLSAKYTGRVKFGTVNLATNKGLAIAKALNLPSLASMYEVITPEKNHTFGRSDGEYLNYDSMALLLRTLHPEVNDIFLLSLIFINVMCWFELAISRGNLLKRLGCLLWCVGKWNCLLILMWLPALGLYQLPYTDSVLDYVLKLLRMFSLTPLAACLRADWLWFTSVNCTFVVTTFVAFAAIVGILNYLYRGPEIVPTSSDSNNNSATWWGIQWDNYTSQMLRPAGHFTRPISPQEIDMEVRMELLIDRLALPNLWLRPIIASEYIKDLPLWKYTGPCIESDLGSDTDCCPSPRNAGSDAEGEGGDGSGSKKPLMFVCEKCRQLQQQTVQPKSQQELERERMESECACAKYVMDGDYKCQCQTGDHRGGSSLKPSPKRDRNKGTKHCSTAKRSSRTDLNEEAKRAKESMDPEDYELYNSPPGMIPMTECPICLESYKFAVYVCGLPCGHSFHQQCILGWLSRDNHCCPVCRWPAYKAKPCSIHLHAE